MVVWQAVAAEQALKKSAQQRRSSGEWWEAGRCRKVVA